MVLNDILTKTKEKILIEIFFLNKMQKPKIKYLIQKFGKDEILVSKGNTKLKIQMQFFCDQIPGCSDPINPKKKLTMWFICNSFMTKCS